jgi:hypothetical protein
MCNAVDDQQGIKHLIVDPRCVIGHRCASFLDRLTTVTADGGRS